MSTMKSKLRAAPVVISMALASSTALASSHMDAPLITLDDAANTTDVYAFRSADESGNQYLTTAVAVYPFEEPGIGPNKHNFDDDVRYEIHVAVGDDLAKGRATLSYHFDFKTRYKNRNTILQSYLGVIENVDDSNQNLTQTYTVRQTDTRGSKRTRKLGDGVVPPNNQGLVTPKYNRNDDGDQPAKGGVDTVAELDDYTWQSIYELKDGHQVFAGQRDDGFYADIQSIFDLDFTFGGQNKPFDSQGGFNLHTIVLNIPIDELGGDQQVVGVYATTSRRMETVLRNNRNQTKGKFVQVGRQGNPLFNEAFVAIADKDRYSRSEPTRDRKLFRKYANTPELAAVLVPLLGLPENLLDDRSDLVGIFIPDLIKVDLSTGPARLTGDIDDSGFSRLGVFGGDVLISTVQDGLPGFAPGTIPGGWPNGRRFGDDVLDIGVSAVISDLRTNPLDVRVAGDGVDANDITYNKVFPYAATPLNGRNHGHNDS